MLLSILRTFLNADFCFAKNRNTLPHSEKTITTQSIYTFPCVYKTYVYIAIYIYVCVYSCVGACVSACVGLYTCTFSDNNSTSHCMVRLHFTIAKADHTQSFPILTKAVLVVDFTTSNFFSLTFILDCVQGTRDLKKTISETRVLAA